MQLDKIGLSVTLPEHLCPGQMHSKAEGPYALQLGEIEENKVTIQKVKAAMLQEEVSTTASELEGTLVRVG